MPQGDGTGPFWAQGKWNCRRGMGRGEGRSPGRGFGRFRGEQAEEDLDSLKCYAENLKSELELVLKKISSMEKGTKK